MKEKSIINIEYHVSMLLLMFITTIYSINGYDKWIYALISWLFWFLILSYRNDSLKFNTLLFPLIIFFSEYYEIPIYILRFTIPEIPYGIDYVGFTIKSLMIIWVMIELKENGYDYVGFIKDLMIFSIFYIPISYYMLYYHNSRFLLITFKLMCLLFVMYELFVKGVRKNGLS
jgi:hypothetical protein